MAQTVRFAIEMEDNEAWELAQFVKRAGWDHFRSCAENDDEAYVIRDAVVKLERTLAEAGYAPR